MKATLTFAVAILTLAVSSALATNSNAPSATAVVNSDGSLARGLHANTSTHIRKGVYQVDFRKNVQNCSVTATIGLSGSAGSSEPGTVTVVGRSEDDKGVYVQTFNAKGKPADLGFHMIVQC
jgi:hypothetical protein